MDLFDKKHAKSVLLAFGQAYNAIENPHQLTKKEIEFLDQVSTQLEESGRIVPVRLVLFVEMIREKSWSIETLKSFGGMKGIGVAFLDQCFGKSSPPQQRLHSKAARKILQCLLPEVGSEIKGTFKSTDDLQKASGYEHRERDFKEVIDVLDHQLRLLTPTANLDGEDSQTKRYQLTHDYLVPAIREWLTREQKRSVAGRAHVCLVERSEEWNQSPERRRLPSLSEYLRIQFFTNSKQRTSAQSSMMRAASRFYLTTLLAATISAVLLGWISVEVFGRIRTHALINRLVDSRDDEVLSIVRKLEPFRRWANNPIKRELAAVASSDNSARQKKIRLLLAIESDDSQAVESLIEMIPEATPQQFDLITNGSKFFSIRSREFLESKIEADTNRKSKLKLLAALALITEPESKAIQPHLQLISQQLMQLNVIELGFWASKFSRLADALTPKFIELAKNESESIERRKLAATLVGVIGKSTPELVLEFALSCEASHFAVVTRVFDDCSPELKRKINQIAEAPLPSERQGQSHCDP